MEKISLPDIPEQKVESRKDYPPEVQKYLAQAMIYYRMKKEDLGNQSLMFAVDCAEKSNSYIELTDIETIMNGHAPSQNRETNVTQRPSLEMSHQSVAEQQQEFAKQLNQVSESIRQQWEVLERELEHKPSWQEAA